MTERPQPGDVLVDQDGDRALVMVVEVVPAMSRTRHINTCSCGGCVEEYPEEDEVTTWVADTEPVEVLTAGGGLTKVVGLIEWWGSVGDTKIMRKLT